ncbi:dhaS [Symbiodinium sp. CCMP2456]|nr:dhaS [Symbiodinium sp. CCMP2456]
MTRAEGIIQRTSRLFIDNKYVEAENGARLPVLSPTDGKSFASIAHASTGDVDRAVRSARRCFDEGDWASRSPEVRVDSSSFG